MTWSRAKTLKKVEKALATKKQNRRYQVRRQRRILNAGKNIPLRLGNSSHRFRYGEGVGDALYTTNKNDEIYYGNDEE